MFTQGESEGLRFRSAEAQRAKEEDFVPSLGMRGGEQILDHLIARDVRLVDEGEPHAARIAAPFSQCVIKILAESIRL